MGSELRTLSVAITVDTMGPRGRLLCACKCVGIAIYSADKAKGNQVSQARGSWNSLLAHCHEGL